jgi:hypothetical protein
MAAEQSREFDLALAARQPTSFWPNPKYLADPVGFARDILGIGSWARMSEMLEVVRDNDKVAVKAGQKLSKSMGAAALMLWWYCSVSGAKARMTATTSKQIEYVLYAAIRELKMGSGLCVDCKRKDPLQPKPCAHSHTIDGHLALRAFVGLQSEDGTRTIQGFASSEAEAIAGFSGVNQFWVLDEASGIDDAIYDVVRGNLMAGGKFLAISNPTRTMGWFYRLFTTEEGQNFCTMTIAAHDSPNVITGQQIIPGLATRNSVQEIIDEYGAGSAVVRVRVDGEFADTEAGKIFTPELVKLAEQRKIVDDKHVLCIGIDPSGPSGTGDDSGWCALRGKQMLRLAGALGLDEDAHLARLLQWLDELAQPGEIPYVAIDREGAVGARVYGTIKAYCETTQRARCRGIRSSDAAYDKIKYHYRRDELCASTFAWITSGGMLLGDVKLEQDLLALEWIEDSKGRTMLASKKAIHKKLGRSPDRYDALSLAVQFCSKLLVARGAVATTKTPTQQRAPSGAIDPYSGPFR